MVKKAKEEGYAENTPDPVDAAAKYALRHGFNKKVKEVSFQNWQLLTAETCSAISPADCLRHDRRGPSSTMDLSSFYRLLVILNMST